MTIEEKYFELREALGRGEDKDLRQIRPAPCFSDINSVDVIDQRNAISVSLEKIIVKLGGEPVIARMEYDQKDWHEIVEANRINIIKIMDLLGIE